MAVLSVVVVTGAPAGVGRAAVREFARRGADVGLLARDSDGLADPDQVEIGPEEFRRVTEVAYLGYVYGTRAALARMRPRDRGTVVQLAATSHRGWLGLAAAGLAGVAWVRR